MDVGGAWTVDFWVNPEVLPPVRVYYLVNKWVNGAEDKNVALLSDGRILAFLFPLGGVAFSNTALPVDTFSHVAVTYDGSFIRIYINGALDATQAVSGTVNNLSFGNLYFGQNPGRQAVDAHDPFLGVLDEVEWLNTTLSAPEIEAIFLAGSAGKCGVQPPLAQIIEDMIDAVNALTLNKKDKGKLVGKLEATLKACSHMGRFIKDVSALIKKGKLSLGDAEPLIGAAQAIKAGLGCP